MAHTAQELFDKSATHIMQQTERSTNGSGKCSYRGVNGNMCAIGVLIPDELYRSEMDEKLQSAVAVARLYPDLGFEPFVPMLRSLQSLHDAFETRSYGNISAMYTTLKGIAKSNSLNTKALRKFKPRLPALVIE